jgi:hypothetical protein
MRARPRSARARTVGGEPPSPPPIGVRGLSPRTFPAPSGVPNPRAKAELSRGLRFPPAPEDQAAEGEAEAEGAHRETSDREGLTPGREALPAPERLALLGRERFAAALLSDRAAGPETEVEVVENLG